MAVILDDDVPLILTLDEGESAPLAPSNSLGQKELPSKSKLMDSWVGGAFSLSVQGVRDRWAPISKRKKSPVTHLKCDIEFAPGSLWV